MKFEFVDQKERYYAKIKVIGVGGAGGNAINNMIGSKLNGVDFIVANTDCQDLDRSECNYRVQLGPNTTKGLGAGADTDLGQKSAEESANEIKESIDGADMAFITAGMGGGTGTGASPVFARICKECGALTVAVVTKPFAFEGEKRKQRALQGIEELKDEVDSLIIIPNERLLSLGSKSSTFKELIARADEVLLHAVRGISDLIISNGFINLDFADVKKVMAEMGTAIMGMGTARGENRASEAAQMAINSPLLEDISISGARGVLMNITGPSDITMDEMNEACNYIKQEIQKDADIYWGVVFNDQMEDEIQVTVIATGIGQDNRVRSRKERDSRAMAGEYEKRKVVNIRDATSEELKEEWAARLPDGSTFGSINEVDLDDPPYERWNKDYSSETEERTHDKKRNRILKKFGLKDNLDIPTFRRLGFD